MSYAKWRGVQSVSVSYPDHGRRGDAYRLRLSAWQNKESSARRSNTFLDWQCADFLCPSGGFTDNVFPAGKTPGKRRQNSFDTINHGRALVSDLSGSTSPSQDGL